MANYLFYDLETTGLNPAFDQILRFAAIKTGHAMQELERYEIAVQLRPDVIPSPLALLTNRLALDELQSGSCEYEAVQRIHALFNSPETISIGYNNLGFDDEFLRFSYYRNLLSPYTHQYRNGCRRMDMLPIATIYYLYKPDVLHWPHEEGKPTLKLEHLKEANHLAEGAAHDAMVDVEATLALAKRLSREKQVWLYVNGYFEKTTDQARCRQLPVSFSSDAGEHRLGLMVGSQFGSDCQFQVPVLSIGQSIPYANQSLWLRMDLPELQQFSKDNFDDTTWVIRKRMGEPDILLPPLKRYMDKLSQETQTILSQNQQWLLGHPQRFQNIIDYHQHFRYPVIPDVDVDAALYETGFTSPQDEAVSRRFHKLPLSEKARSIPNFGSPAMRQLAVRLLFRNYYRQRPPLPIQDMKHYMAKVAAADTQSGLQDYKGQKRLTPQSALLEIENIKKKGDLDQFQFQIVNRLEAYLQRFSQNTHQLFSEDPSEA
jgi:exodeoxyribonuclease-1